MDSLPKDKMLGFHPNTMQHLRELYNLDKPGQMDEAVNLLDDWVKKQNHLTKKDYSREFLERSIISLKGSVERAKMQIDKICTVRTLMPHFFDKYTVKDFKELRCYFTQAALPMLTDDHYRVYFTSLRGDGLSSKLFFQLYVYGVFLCEYIKAHDYCDGLVAVFDLRNANVAEYISVLNLMDLRQIITIGMQGYCMRVKGIHILTSSTAIDILVRIFKQMFGTKVGNRIHVHKNDETLYNYIPKKILPVELGGSEKSLTSLNDDWFEVLSSEEYSSYMKEMNNARTDESLRASFKSHGDLLGVTGSFRSLNVD